MEKVLLYTNYPAPHQERLEKAFRDAGFDAVWVAPDPKDSAVRERACREIQDSSVAILGAGIPSSVLESSAALKWVHFDWVGIEGAATRELFRKGVIITNGSGRNSICLSEHVFYFIFTMTYETRHVFEAQDSRQWKVQHDYPYSSLYGRTMLILGTGSIGREIALRAKAFGMKTIGFSRSKKPGLDMFDELLSSDEGARLVDAVSSADFLVVAASLNASSYHMVNREVLSAMKKDAYVINISRGSVIDEEALIEALKEKRIAGAGLDTVEHEPLSPESPLWNLKNVVITPHSTPQSPLKFEIGVSTVVDNIPKYLSGEKLINAQSEKDLLN